MQMDRLTIILFMNSTDSVLYQAVFSNLHHQHQLWLLSGQAGRGAHILQGGVLSFCPSESSA